MSTIHSLEQLRKETENEFNQLVLFQFDVWMVIGVDEDKEDYYYVLERKVSDEVNTIYLSASYKYELLKPYLPSQKYEELVWLWNNNGMSNNTAI